MTTELLRLVLLAESVVLVVVLLSFAAGALRSSWRRRRHAPRVEAARMELAAALGTDAPSLEALQALAPEARLGVLMEMAPSVGGEHLRQIAESLGLLELAGSWCRSRRWWRRLRGARVFTSLGGGSTVVPALLADASPEVRAEAALWVGSHPTPERLRRLVPLLGDPATVTRSAAADALLRAGRAAVPALVTFLQQRPGEGVALALLVARGVAEPRLLPAAQRYSRAPEPKVRTLAAVLLAHIGGSEATSRLGELLADPDATVRAAACRGMARLDAWELAPRIGPLLADPEWPARRAAALALADLGAPGRLYLRRASKAQVSDVASLATRALAIPDPRSVLGP